MPRRSAGILLYRFRDEQLEVFLVHPGGPFWARKDAAAWSIPKGEYDPDEDALDAARRELAEETGVQLQRPLHDLGEVRQSGGKIVQAWAAPYEGDITINLDNTFEMEWPPKSGRRQAFPEVDRGDWFTTGVAREKLHKGQVPLLDRLQRELERPPA